MGKWLLNIELPLLAVVAEVDNPEAQLALMDLFDDMPEDVGELLLDDRIYELIDFYTCSDYSWLGRFARIPSRSYGEDAKACYLKTSPDVITNVLNADWRRETLLQMKALSESEGPYLVHLLLPHRVVHDGKLAIVKDNKTIKQVFLSDCEKDCLLSVIESVKPKLNQGKHHMYPYPLGKGKVAATFKAWDKNNDEYAKSLLRIAFEYYGGDELPAKDLYAWDEKNATYVRFMHSGNCEYHGYDVPIMDVPESVKKCYGIFK